MSATRASIRAATAADAGTIAGLLGELGYPALADAIPRRLERMEAEGQHILLAELDGRVIGLASLYVRSVIVDDAPFARLAALVVDRASRGRGAGSALVAEAERLARVAGCSLMEVTSGLHRPEAHRFYAGLGYEERPRRFVKRLATRSPERRSAGSASPGSRRRRHAQRPRGRLRAHVERVRRLEAWDVGNENITRSAGAHSALNCAADQLTARGP